VIFFEVAKFIVLKKKNTIGVILSFLWTIGCFLYNGCWSLYV